MALVVAGLLNKQVGGELGVSEITLKAHRGKVMEKIKAGSLADLVKMAAKLRPFLASLRIAHYLAVVDALLTLHNINGPDGTVIPAIPVNFFYVASRHGNQWLIEDGRAHFAPAPANSMTSRN